MKVGLKIRTEPINFGPPYGAFTVFTVHSTKPLRFTAGGYGLFRIPRRLVAKRFIEVVD